MHKVVLVTRKTRLTELICKYNTIEQARFYIEHRGVDFSDYVDVPHVIQAVLKLPELPGSLPEYRSSIIVCFL